MYQSKKSRQKNKSSKKDKSCEREDVTDQATKDCRDKAIKDHVESMQGIKVDDS